MWCLQTFIRLQGWACVRNKTSECLSTSGLIQIMTEVKQSLPTLFPQPLLNLLEGCSDLLISQNMQICVSADEHVCACSSSTFVLLSLLWIKPSRQYIRLTGDAFPARTNRLLRSRSCCFLDVKRHVLSVATGHTLTEPVRKSIQYVNPAVWCFH